MYILYRTYYDSVSPVSELVTLSLQMFQITRSSYDVKRFRRIRVPWICVHKICGSSDLWNSGSWKFTNGLIPGNSIVMITPNNYWLRIYKYYSINSINRLVPVGKGEGERCDECGSQNTHCQIACAHRLLYSITLRSLLRCNKAKLCDVNNAYKLIGFTAHYRSLAHSKVPKIITYISSQIEITD